MSKEIETYRSNYLKGVRQLRVDREGLDSDKAVAEYLGMGIATFSKIKDKHQLPTIEHGITLCKKGGYNANWLFLGLGDMSMRTQNTLNDIMDEIQGKKQKGKVVPFKAKTATGK